MELDRLPLSTVKEAVFEALERRLLRAFESRDLSELERLVDDRCIGVGILGTQYSKADFIRDHYGKVCLKSFAVVSMRVVEEPTYAVVQADWEVDMTVDKSVFKGRVRATRTWVKRNPGWKMIGFHVSDARLATVWEQVTKR
jgi:hypothetical protein